MSKDNWKSLVHDIQFELPGLDKAIVTRNIEMRIFPNLMTVVINSEKGIHAKNALIQIKSLVNEKKIPLVFPDEDEKFPSEDLSNTLQLRRIYLASGGIGLRIFIFPLALPHLSSTDDSEQSVNRVRQVMYDTYNDHKRLTTQRLFQPGNPPRETGPQK